jgi:hypothetical protein
MCSVAIGETTPLAAVLVVVFLAHPLVLEHPVDVGVDEIKVREVVQGGHLKYVVNTRGRTTDNK